MYVFKGGSCIRCRTPRLKQNTKMENGRTEVDNGGLSELYAEERKRKVSTLSYDHCQGKHDSPSQLAGTNMYLVSVSICALCKLTLHAFIIDQRSIYPTNVKTIISAVSSFSHS